jgi:hypothetical protein
MSCYEKMVIDDKGSQCRAWLYQLSYRLAPDRNRTGDKWKH